MFAFDRLSEIYEKMVEMTERTGRGVFHFNRPVERIERTSDGVVATDARGAVEHFDALVFACPANVALRVLPSRAFENGSLSVRSNTSTTSRSPTPIAPTWSGTMSSTTSAEISTSSARTPTQPIESRCPFDLSHYQPQLQSSIYQTIFLDRASDEGRWTIDEIDPGQILFSKPWTQFSHTWQHYVRVVPWLRFLQGRQRTYYAGSWTLANTHEVATISGFAAAYRLEPPIPSKKTSSSLAQFETYLGVVHGIAFEGGSPASRR